MAVVDGTFYTKKLGSGIELEFPEYSENKRLNLEPDIMEYDGKTFKPKFDLIKGVKTLKELGIKLDFENDLITIDKIPMPMRTIKELNKPNMAYQLYKNQENLKAVGMKFTRNEPESTKELTNRAVKILDAKYDKADLPAIVEETCGHLNKFQRQELLRLL